MPDPVDDLRRLEPWLPAIVRAADEVSIRRSILAGTCLRETLGSWARGYTRQGTHLGWGDGRHAFGLFQCDKRFWEMAIRGMLHGHELLTPLGQARFAAAIIAGAALFLTARHPGSPLLELAAVCAHNAALDKVDAQLDANSSPDAVTEGGDYGSDIVGRAERLERRDPNVFHPAAG